jgi:RNA polymerase sigma factor (sigma-70 family)
MDTTDLICRVDNNAPKGVSITAVTKLKHAVLWAAVKKYGSQQIIARKLKISPATFGQWVALKSAPPLKPKDRWTACRLATLDKRCLKLFGLPLCVLFPPELRRNVAFLRSPKVFERTEIVRAAALEAYALSTRDRLLAQAAEPIGYVTGIEQNETLRHAIDTVLTAREQLVIRCRFGIAENPQEAAYSLTLEEVGAKLGLQKERVRQIENCALRKLRDATSPAVKRCHAAWSD